ncbi:hypothetical protein F2Q69_00063913 [Brassica cretica]|uniref:Glutaminyl-tRNA synthetase class Ib non-specific RNA-binding domain-containing protein n=1 Tax=Brassica cretica TaxID=69181 RepID=A0A8S9RMR7_BRACR|nr:hypothetical protein F2Q69_00063913 [Brassica cretica]
MAPNDDESVKFFLSIGLDEKTATTTINNPKVTANLTAVIHEVSFLVSPPSSPVSSLSSSFFSPRYCCIRHRYAGVTNGCDRTTGNLLYTHNWMLQFRFLTITLLRTSRVEVSAEDIEKAADEVFEENKKTIVEQRYRTNDLEDLKNRFQGFEQYDDGELAQRRSRRPRWRNASPSDEGEGGGRSLTLNGGGRSLTSRSNSGSSTRLSHRFSHSIQTCGGVGGEADGGVCGEAGGGSGGGAGGRMIM